MGKKPTKFDEGIIVKTSTTAPSAEGEIRNKDSKLQTYIDGAERDIVTDDQTQTLENKTIDGTSATGNNTVTTDADQVTYDNSTSGLTATNSQDAIDEVEARLDTAESNITTNASGLADHLADTTDAHDASAISNIPSGNLAATDVQSALNELQTDVDTRALDVDLTAHISDTVDAHDASAISNVPSGNLVATDVQTALNELQTDVDTRALDSDLTAHLNDTTDAHDASAISFDNVASGLTATEVQSAIDEVEGRLDTAESNITTNASNLSDHLADTVDAHDASAISYDNSTSGLTATEAQSAIDEVEGRLDTAESSLSSHTGATSGVHGTTGDVVGTTDTQTLTNKTITGASIQTPSRLDFKQDTLANLETYALTATDGQAVYATDTDQYYGIVGNALVALGGGGSGSLSTFYTQDMEDLQDVSDFSTGNNATFAGGGTVAGTLALETTVEIAGDKSLKFTQASGSLNDYFMSEEITIENKQQGNIVGIRGYYEYDGDNGDFELVVYDETNDTVLIRESLNGTTQATKFEFNNIRIPSNCTSIRYGAQVAVENIGAILLIDDIEFNVDPRFIGQWVEVNAVELSGSGGELITAGTENIVFNGSGIGWDGSSYDYTVQKSGSIVNLTGSVFWDTNSGAIISVYVNGTFYKSVSDNIATTRLKPIGIEIPNLSYGDVVSLRSSLAITLETSGDYHWLNIIETANRRSIMSEVESGWKIQEGIEIDATTTAPTKGTTTVDRVVWKIENGIMIARYEYLQPAAGGSAGSGDYLFSIPTDAPDLDLSKVQVTTAAYSGTAVAGGVAHLDSNGWVAGGTSGGELQAIAYDSRRFRIYSKAVYSSTNLMSNSYYGLSNAKGMTLTIRVPIKGSSSQIISIPVDEIIADGNEYAVFGKIITLADGTRYQVYRRAWEFSASMATGLPLTYVPADENWANFSGSNTFVHEIGSATNYRITNYSYSTGNVTGSVGGAYTGTNTVAKFDYYDTARPLN